MLVNVVNEGESMCDRIFFPTHVPEAIALWLSDLACFRSGEEASVLAVT
jgi:hypothetical protein